MDTDDLEPVKKRVAKKDFERMSITDLHEYIVELRAEIERAETAIKRKDKARQGAESVFKS